jgi:hypothetical protein
MRGVASIALGHVFVSDELRVANARENPAIRRTNLFITSFRDMRQSEHLGPLHFAVQSMADFQGQPIWGRALVGAGWGVDRDLVGISAPSVASVSCGSRGDGDPSACAT